jgi:cytochrome c-type biogenesis protein
MPLIPYRSLTKWSFFLFVVLCSAMFCSSLPGSSQESALAPDFHAVDVNGKSLSLSDYRGEVVLLHITNIENPLCRECEQALGSQTRELEKLKQKGAEIITLNVRKNPYSKDGKSLSESWWHINVTWPWIEDFEPYPLTSKYINYLTLEGGFANPTLLLIDEQGQIASVYHVYQLGKGELDGIQSADTLYNKIENIERGEATGAGFEGTASRQSITYLGMFTLGIITSLSPCSVALLLAMFSYIRQCNDLSVL